MPLRLDIKRKLSSRSERVKSVDLHPTEPWVLSALYSGSVTIWDYDAQSLVKTLDVGTLPIRSAKFIARKQWIVTVGDDMHVRVFNYNTLERVTAFEAHSDYIRHVEVHPTLPCLLTCSDDMTIKLWDWDRNWTCSQVFEGHAHFVMMAKFNPKDTNTFASASLDRSVKVWGLNAAHPHFSLDGHERGVNCVDYYPGGDKPYLVSGADDRSVKVWDYQTKAVVHTLEGHGNNLTAVLYHPRLPLIISACEDGAVRMWHATTFRAETTLNYGMERAWSLAPLTTANKLAVGYDEGSVVIRLGHDTPVVSMDPSGKLIWTNNNDIFSASVKGVVSDMQLSDGEKLPLPARELGSCEVYPQRVRHNSNGRYVCVCGDGEYIIYTSQQLRNKAFGSALDFAWSPSGTGDYVTRESTSKLTLFRNFKEVKSVVPRVCSAEGLFGGSGAIGVKGNDCVAMYDWDEFRLIRKIDVGVKNVYWSDSGSLVVLACESSFFVLQYDKEVVANAFASGKYSEDEGVQGSFELVHEISETVKTGSWVGDCFLYTNDNGRLNYYVGGEVMTLAHLDQKLYMLGYLPKENLVFLMDKMKHVVSYTVSLVMLEYQTAVVRRDFDTANAILPKIPTEQMDYVARFLEAQGFKEEALQLSTDPDQRFDLAVQLAKLDLAHEIILNEVDASLTTDTQHKWKQLGDLALNAFQLELAEDCAMRAEDFSLLLMLYASRGDAKGLEKLATLAHEKKRFNVVFLCYLLLQRSEDCVQVLQETMRYPEAAFFARSYCPSNVSDVLEVWREDLATVSTRAAKALADPNVNPELFENLGLSLEGEEQVKKMGVWRAKEYLKMKDMVEGGEVLQSVLAGAFVGRQVDVSMPEETKEHEDEMERLEQVQREEERQREEAERLEEEREREQERQRIELEKQQAELQRQEEERLKEEMQRQQVEMQRQEEERRVEMERQAEFQRQEEERLKEELERQEEERLKEELKQQEWEKQEEEAVEAELAAASTSVAASAVEEAATTGDLLDFELDNEDIEFDEEDDADWGEM